MIELKESSESEVRTLRLTLTERLKEIENLKGSLNESNTNI